MDLAPSPGSVSLTLEKGACCLCGGTEGEVVVERSDLMLGATAQRFALAKCPRCRVLFLDPRPTAGDLELLYPEKEYYTRDVRALSEVVSRRSSGPKQRLQMRILNAYGHVTKSKVESRKSKVGGRPGLRHPFRHLFEAIGKMTLFPLLVRQSALLRTLVYNRRFLRFRRRAARILEVGFGNGLLLFALSHLDTELFGTEISDKTCQAVSDALDVKTFCGQIWDAKYAEGQFDLIIFSHSLEHLTDPMRALREARRILAPDGGLLISAPNPNCFSARLFKEHWSGYDFPRHLFLFGREALSKMAEEAGFRLQAVKSPLEGCVHHLAESINSRLGRRLVPDAVTRALPVEVLYLPLVLFRTGDVITMYLRPV